MEKEEFLKVYRHSMAHILAKAVIEIFGKDGDNKRFIEKINAAVSILQHQGTE